MRGFNEVDVFLDFQTPGKTGLRLLDETFAKFGKLTFLDIVKGAPWWKYVVSRLGEIRGYETKCSK